MGRKTITSGEFRLSDFLFSTLIAYAVFFFTNNLIYAIVVGLIIILIAIYISSKRKQS